MRKEVVDPNSGAILFKQDEDGLMLEMLKKKVEELEKAKLADRKRIRDLEDKINKLLGQ